MLGAPMDALHCRLLPALVVALPLFLSGTQATGQFTTIINLPPDSLPGSVLSNTQINAGVGGTIGDGLVLGAPSGAVQNVELNIVGGQIGDDGSALEGATVNLISGSLGSDFLAGTDSILNISGGTFGRRLETAGNSALEISGGEFYLNGSIFGGFPNIGSTRMLTLSATDVLSGTLADGTPMVVTGRLGDSIGSSSLTLRRAALPTVDASMILSAADTAPQGIREGQSLIVFGGNVSDDFNAGRGSSLDLIAGTIGSDLEAVSAELRLSGTVGSGLAALDESRVLITGGSVGNGLSLFTGSMAEVTGGVVGEDFTVHRGSLANVRGGTIREGLLARSGSMINVSDGTVEGSVTVERNSDLNIRGGEFSETLNALAASRVNISGGAIGDDFNVEFVASANLFGSQFLLDGVDITNTVAANYPFLLADRDKTLSGLLADGTPFSFELNSTDVGLADFFDPNARLRLIVGLPGDNNRDGEVDARDYTLWRDSLGATGSDLATDSNFDGVVNERDYLLWKEHFGLTLASSNSSAISGAVPEPSTVWLLLVASLSASYFSRAGR